MNCPKCKSPLVVAKSELKTRLLSKKVDSILTMVCINPKCDNYSGRDLNNPRIIVETVRNKA